MSDQGEVFLRVRFDDDQATRDLDRTVNDAVRKVEGKGATRATKPGARASSAGVVADELRDLAGNSPAATKALQAVEASMGGVTTGALAIGAAVTVAAVGYLKMANAGIDAFTKLAGEVRTFSARSGAAAEEASRFVAVADDYGLAATTMSNSLFFLGRAVSTNRDGLRQLGVQVATNRDGSTNLQQTLINVADAYSRQTDAAKRAELVQAALGRQGRDLIPILQAGGQALEEMLANTPAGQILTDDDLQKARDFYIATDNLKDSVDEISIAVGRDLVPQIAAVANGLGNAVRWANELLEPIGGLGTVLARLPEAIPGFGSIIGGLRMWGQRGKEAADVTDDLKGGVDELAASFDDMYAAQIKAIEGELRVVSAHNQLEDSYTKIWDATVAYNEALNRTGQFAEADRRATERLANARDRLADATRGIRDAEEDVADRREKLVEAEFRFGRQSREAKDARGELRDAEEKLADQHDEVRDATKAAAEAQRELNEAQAAGGPGSREARDAARDLKRAQDEQKESALAAAKAEAQLAVDTATAKGEMLTAEQQADLFRQKLEGVASTMAPDSPLRKYLLETAAAVAALRTEFSLPFGEVGGGDWAAPPAAPTSPQYVPPNHTGTTSPPTTRGDYQQGTMATKSAVTIENLNVANDVDALQVPYDVAWLVGGVR